MAAAAGDGKEVRVKVAPSDSTVRGCDRILSRFMMFVKGVNQVERYRSFALTQFGGDVAAFAQLSMAQKLPYVTAFVVNMRKKHSMARVFYVDITDDAACKQAGFVFEKDCYSFDSYTVTFKNLMAALNRAELEWTKAHQALTGLFVYLS